MSSRLQKLSMGVKVPLNKVAVFDQSDILLENPTPKLLTNKIATKAIVVNIVIKIKVTRFCISSFL